MWLIDTTTLKLKSFSDDERSYAILSHTWGPDGDEVTFQEMQEPMSKATRSKAGFEKIQKTCEIARKQYRLKYAWVDTCCIDKSSSAELSEAINSMFTWYRKSKVCLAYLSDVGRSTDSFRQSRWFTRGWTLQELLAPFDLRFFNRRWEAIGTRMSLSGEISKATDIPDDILHNRKVLSQIPVAARMSWAAQRQTKRKEDIAYCLMGIFNINMPMLYGEGSKAFLRLQEEIIKQSVDTSIFLWPSIKGSTGFTGLLAGSPALFTGMGGVVKDHHSFEPVEYYLTNLGIVIKAHFQWDEGGRIVFDLRHKLPNGENARLVLQPVASNSAVRVGIQESNLVSSPVTSRSAMSRFVVAKRLHVIESHRLLKSSLRLKLSGAQFTATHSIPEHLLHCIAARGRDMELRLFPWRDERFVGLLVFGSGCGKVLKIDCDYSNGTWRCQVRAKWSTTVTERRRPLSEEVSSNSSEKTDWDTTIDLKHPSDVLKGCKISASFRSFVHRLPVSQAELTINCTAYGDDSDNK